jgi:hypothetical protein
MGGFLLSPGLAVAGAIFWRRRSCHGERRPSYCRRLRSERNTGGPLNRGRFLLREKDLHGARARGL